MYTMVYQYTQLVCSRSTRSRPPFAEHQEQLLPANIDVHQGQTLPYPKNPEEVLDQTILFLVHRHKLSILDRICVTGNDGKTSIFQRSLKRLSLFSRQLLIWVQETKIIILCKKTCNSDRCVESAFHNCRSSLWFCPSLLPVVSVAHLQHIRHGLFTHTLNERWDCSRMLTNSDCWFEMIRVCLGSAMKLVAASSGATSFGSWPSHQISVGP